MPFVFFFDRHARRGSEATSMHRSNLAVEDFSAQKTGVCPNWFSATLGSAPWTKDFSTMSTSHSRMHDDAYSKDSPAFFERKPGCQNPWTFLRSLPVTKGMRPSLTMPSMSSAVTSARTSRSTTPCASRHGTAVPSPQNSRERRSCWHTGLVQS